MKHKQDKESIPSGVCVCVCVVRVIIKITVLMICLSRLKNNFEYAAIHFKTPLCYNPLGFKVQ